MVSWLEESIVVNWPACSRKPQETNITVVFPENGPSTVENRERRFD